jgi:quinoprotein glucose dehydrogenase
VTHHGKKVDAVAQVSKQGYVFVFDRVNGKSLFPIRRRKYLASDVPGEIAVKEQSLPTKPAPFARQLLTEDMLTDRTPEAHKWAVEEFHKQRSAGQFVPFGLEKGTILFPGMDGGAEWGGAAVDPETSVLYVNANDLPWSGKLAENSEESSGRGLYLSNCSICHGDDRMGSPPAVPAIVDVDKRLSHDEIVGTISKGRGRMPAFPNFSAQQITAVIDYVARGEDKGVSLAGSTAAKMKYRFAGQLRLYDPDGYPAVVPPWGTLSAINLNTGAYEWKIPLGEYPELATQGLKSTGTENYGGPIVTGGGLVFIAATNFDKKFRAFDKATGELLWEATLPFSGNATPITYEIDGRQYLVIAAGGGKDYGKKGANSLRSASGGVYVAFALPK